MGSPVHTRDQAVQYLLDRINYERTIEIPYGENRFKLERMRKLSDRLGAPHDRLAIIHVAGSKGKGSTSTMIAAVGTACGYRTGLFTSPHLLRLEERISIDGKPIAGEELIEQVNAVAAVVAEMDLEAERSGTPWDTPTFFEVITAVSLNYFAEQQVDAVVLEVGLGGRLDSTNICTPLCSVITSIGMDHTRQLGSTLDQIAYEKAGIIKLGVPVVSGVVGDEARQVIRQTAAERGCLLLELNTHFRSNYLASVRDDSSDGVQSRFDFSIDDGCDLLGQPLCGVELAMLGDHQANNAALALAVAAVLRRQGFELPTRHVRAGLAIAKCRSRIEVVARQPTIVLDTAHNESSLRALLTTLDESFPQRRSERVVILAATRGKDVGQMLRMLLPWCRCLVFTRYLENPRAFPPEQLLELAEQLAAEFEMPASFSTASNPAAALDVARQLVGPDSLLCITGSFFLAAEMDAFVRTNTLFRNVGSQQPH